MSRETLLKSFIAELRPLLKKYSVAICPEADADDDSGLSCCLSVQQIVKPDNGPLQYHTLCEYDELSCF